MKLSTTVGFLFSICLVQGCNAGSGSTKPESEVKSATSSSNKALSSSTTKDQQFAEELQKLEKRNANAEAQQAIASGNPSVIGYYSGRAGLKVSGFTEQQQAAQRCKVTPIDNMGDVIYGTNHLKYRIAMRNFATAYNSKMLAACL